MPLSRRFSARRRQRGREVTIDILKLRDFVVPLIVGEIQARTNRGLDVNGNAFKPYSASYQRQLRMSGRNTSPVALRQTGSMMGSLRLVRTLGFGLGGQASAEARRLMLEIGIGPEPGPAYSLTKKGMKRRGTRSVPNNVLARMHHNGEGRLPARPFMGLSKRELAKISRKARRAPGLVRQK